MKSRAIPQYPEAEQQLPPCCKDGSQEYPRLFPAATLPHVLSGVNALLFKYLKNRLSFVGYATPKVANARPQMLCRIVDFIVEYKRQPLADARNKITITQRLKWILILRVGTSGRRTEPSENECGYVIQRDQPTVRMEK